MGLPEDPQKFRAYVRNWLERNYASFLESWDGPRDARNLDLRRAWEDRLCAHGWSGLGWPREFGGQALDLARQAIFHEEHALCGAPLGVNLVGHGILGPTLLHFGSAAQKQRFLTGILNNQVVWCQGYSEPASGSDLASLRSRARNVGNGWVLNGHKIWTSFADRADWCFVLARSNPDVAPHKGLSFFLVDMRQPGVRVAPIRQLTGEHEFCEVFFEDVSIDADCLVGEPGDGWRIAMAAASFERGTYFLPRLVRFRQELQAVRKDIEAAGRHVATATAHGWKMRWARLAVDSHVLRLKADQALAAARSGTPPGPEGSTTKLLWSEAHQRLLELSIEIRGDGLLRPRSGSGTDDFDLLQHTWLWTRAETILAGTSEIQRNIVAERMLGLPKGA
ncbi:MAG: acyl-CoA dehydrogenase family protein [Burkholderiaceae bacterium]